MTAFPPDWVESTVGSVLSLKYGKALDSNLRDPDGPVPVVGSAGRMTGTHEPLVAEPVLLIGRKGNVGAVQFESDGCWPIDTTYYALIPEHLDARFLLHQLVALDMKKLDSSTTTPSLRRQDLEEQRLVVPPLNEQHRIVELLEDHVSRLDAAANYIDAGLRRCAVLGNQLLSGHLAAVQTREVALRELLEVGFSNGKSVPTREGGFPVLRLTALRDGRIDLAERKQGAWSADDAARFLVQRGDFLISRGNGTLRLVGRGGLVADEPDPVAYPDTLIRARPNVDVIEPGFLALVWNSPLVRRQIEAVAKTTAGIYKVNQRDLGGIILPVPDMGEQVRIVGALSEMGDALAMLTDELERVQRRAESLRRAVLAAAFSGNLNGEASLSVADERIGA